MRSTNLARGAAIRRAQAHVGSATPRSRRARAQRERDLPDRVHDARRRARPGVGDHGLRGAGRRPRRARCHPSRGSRARTGTRTECAPSSTPAAERHLRMEQGAKAARRREEKLVAGVVDEHVDVRRVRSAPPETRARAAAVGTRHRGAVRSEVTGAPRSRRGTRGRRKAATHLGQRPRGAHSERVAGGPDGCRGQTNRQLAPTLFVTPPNRRRSAGKTDRKLDIHQRSELARADRLARPCAATSPARRCTPRRSRARPRSRCCRPHRPRASRCGS